MAEMSTDGTSAHIASIHDPGGEHLLLVDGEPCGWVGFTHGLGRDPEDPNGFDYRPWSDRGFGVWARLNNGYGSEGTIPLPRYYDDFAQRCANFVIGSRGCRVWVIGNEMNHAQERPEGSDGMSAPITPELYAQCYRKVRARIRAQAGPDHQVIAGAVAPYNNQTAYDGNPMGDWVTYFQQLCQLLEGECDGFGLHAYTWAHDPALVTSEEKMDPPYDHRRKQFRVYRDFLAVVPTSMRYLPVYITEANPGGAGQPWRDVNLGWYQMAVAEVDGWNRSGGQTIRCVSAYCWPARADGMWIYDKAWLHEDLHDAAARGHRWDIYPVEPEKPRVLTIRDLVDVLTTHPTKRYATRSLDAIELLVAHYSGTPADCPAEAIAQWHVNNNGWPGAGYHFNVRWDGTIEQCQRLRTWSYHAGNANRISVGVCFPGLWTDSPPTDSQLASGRLLYGWLMDELDLRADAVVGHKDVMDTQCPGPLWEQWREKLLP